MTVIRPQVDWERSSQPVSGPGPKGNPDRWIIHYPGNNGFHEPRTDAEMVGYLRTMQNSYVTGRGYSVGYSVIVSQSGSAWAGRGLEGHPGVRVYNPASNPGKKLNEGNINNVSRSIQIAVSGQGEASPEAVATVNAIIATQPGWPVLWHGQVDYTSCAGTGIINQILAGVIGQQDQGDDMVIIEQYRAADTRNWPGTKLTGRKAYRFSAGNGVPAHATAVAATVTVVDPEATGFASVARPGTGVGKTSVLNYGAGQNVANTTFIPLTNKEFDIMTSANAHVVIDVVGYTTR